MMDSLVGRHQDKIAGVLCCWDRVVIQGTLPGLCYAAGMTSYLRTSDIRVFDYPRFAEPLRDLIRENAENLAKKSGVLGTRAQCRLRALNASRRALAKSRPSRAASAAAPDAIPHCQPSATRHRPHTVRGRGAKASRWSWFDNAA